MPLPTRTPIYVALPKSYREVVWHWAGGFKGHPNLHYFPAGAGIGVQRQCLKRWMQEIVSLSFGTQLATTVNPVNAQ